MKYHKSLFLLIFFYCYALQGISLPWHSNTGPKTSTTQLTINQKRTAVKKQHMDKEKLILKHLGKSLGFTKHEWNECLQTIKYMKKNAHTFISAKSYHDPDIPEELYTSITTLLCNNNIDPNGVNIIVHKTHSDKPYTFAAAQTRLNYSYQPTFTPFIQQPHITCNLILYEQIFNESSSNQCALIAHEVEHLCQQHTLMMVIIEQYAQHYLQYSKAVLKHNHYFQQLKVLHEEQAEIYAALKDEHVAQALVNLRSEKLYPNCLDEKHYYHLVEINNAWKI